MMGTNLKLDQFLLCLFHLNADERRVDVHRGHVVHEHGDALADRVLEDVLQQRRLACAQESGQHGDGQKRRRGAHAFLEKGEQLKLGKKKKGSKKMTTSSSSVAAEQLTDLLPVTTLSGFLGCDQIRRNPEEPLSRAAL
jgi:hypothetical protein